MSMTLSNAAAAAKAAKADLTAPVAANNSQVDSAADSRAAQSKQASRNQAQNQAQADAPRRAPAPAPAPAPSATRGAPASQAAQGGKAGKSAAADQTAQASDDSADDVVTTAPLFAQLLNLADLPVTGQDGQPAADAGDGAASDTGSGTATVSAADALSAITSGIATSPLPTYYAPTSAPAARSDGVNAISALNASATRLNLAAAGVAVTPAAQPGADATDAAAAAAATQAAAALVTTSAQAATPQAVYNQAGNAALAALAQNKQAEAPAAGAEAAVQPAPVETDASTPVQPVVSAAPRVQVRVTDSAAPAAKAPESATLAGAGAKDDSRATAASATTTTGTVGFATAAPTATPAAATVKLAGSPEQWQQPLREALGDRLQLQLQRNNDHAVIRLEPPNMGSIEISIRHSAGALQVNLSANNSEVVRQLNTIGDSVRQDLSTRQFSDVAVTVSSSRAQSQAQSDGSGGRSGQQRNQDDGRTPGRALSDEEATSTFAMNERE
jgi:flagellar hook-length control protein FliK